MLLLQRKTIKVSILDVLKFQGTPLKITRKQTIDVVWFQQAENGPSRRHI